MDYLIHYVQSQTNTTEYQTDTAVGNDKNEKFSINKHYHLKNIIYGGGVCMSCNENLSLRIICTSYFDQCLLLEVTCQNQERFLAVIYCSPSQSLKTFYLILKNL